MKVLLLAGDTIGRAMSAPGVRYWEMARHLAVDPRQTATDLAVTNAHSCHYRGKQDDESDG